MSRLVAFLLCFAFAAHARAAEPIPVDDADAARWPAMEAGALDPSGAESVLVDTALIPTFAVRLDENDERIPGYLRLAWWANLSSRSYAGDRFRVGVNFRFDFDETGLRASERAAFRLEPARYSLLSAWVQYDATRDLAITAGRQFFLDTADFLAFDGARVAWRIAGTPLRLDVYGGVRTDVLVTEGSVASSLYELDGVRDLDGLQPLAGATLRWSAVSANRRQASLGYRQSWRLDDDDRALDPALPAGPYTTAQELVASASGDVGPVHLAAAAAWEVALDRLQRARAAITLDGARLAGEDSSFAATSYALEWLRYQPVFALDAIWNYFSANPYDELAFTFAARPSDATRWELRLFLRSFRANTEDRFGNPLAISPGLQPAGGGRAGVVRRFGATQVDVFVQDQHGFGGHRTALESGLLHPFGRGLSAYARLVGVWYGQDLQDRGGGSLGAVGGLAWRGPAGATLSLLLEETVNEFASPVPRVWGVVDFSRWL